MNGQVTGKFLRFRHAACLNLQRETGFKHSVGCKTLPHDRYRGVEQHAVYALGSGGRRGGLSRVSFDTSSGPRKRGPSSKAQTVSSNGAGLSFCHVELAIESKTSFKTGSLPVHMHHCVR